MIGFSEFINKALTKKILRSLVGLVDKRKNVSEGTGFLLKNNNNFYCVTAKHVIKKENKDAILINGMFRFDEIISPGSPGVYDEDFTILVLGNKKITNREFLIFEDLESDGRKHKDDLAAIIGYPSNCVKLLPGQKKIQAQHLRIISKFEKNVRHGKQYRITYKYKRDDITDEFGNDASIVELDGVSGGPIIAIYSSNEKGITIPKSKVVGIVEKWDDDQGIVYGWHSKAIIKYIKYIEKMRTK